MTDRPRVAIAGIFIESNSFCPPFRFTPEENSLLFRGEAFIADARSDNPRVHKEVSGFIRTMDERSDWEPLPILFAGMKPAGPADHGRVMEFLNEIVATMASAGPLDAVYIANHGAMTSTEDEDIEGTIAARIRRAAGTIPVVATLDLHGNISQAHVNALDLAVAYRLDPHYDQFERGVECAEGLLEILAGTKTVVANLRLPLVAPNVSLATDEGPYGEVIAAGQDLIDERIMNVSVLAGFAYSDTSKNGMHVIVTARREEDPDGVRAAEVTEVVATAAWERKARFTWNLTPMDEAIRIAAEVGADPSQPPVFLIDLGDNAGAGGPANSLWMFAGLHEAGARDALVACLYDPGIVAQAQAAGVGGHFEARFTGDNWSGGPKSYNAEAECLALSDGRCMARRGIGKGRSLYAGDSCLIRCGPTLLTVNARHTTMNDPAYVEMLGIGPGDFRSIVLKGRGSSYHKAWGDYFPPERGAIKVDTPGRTSPALDRFDWKRMPRPVWPIDRDAEWSDRRATIG